MFGDGIKLQDAGAALISYEDSVHASYTQNFLTRRSAASRWATITGYQATLSSTGTRGRSPSSIITATGFDSFTVRATTGHLGGDEVLARNFVDVCLGRDESRTDLASGLLSAVMCLAARESAHTQRWTPIGDVYSETFPDRTVSSSPRPARGAGLAQLRTPYRLGGPRLRS